MVDEYKQILSWNVLGITLEQWLNYRSKIIIIIFNKTGSQAHVWKTKLFVNCFHNPTVPKSWKMKEMQLREANEAWLHH